MEIKKCYTDDYGRDCISLECPGTKLIQILDVYELVVEIKLITDFDPIDSCKIIKELMSLLEDEPLEFENCDKEELYYTNLEDNLALTIISESDSIPMGFVPKLIDQIKKRHNPLRKIKCLGFFINSEILEITTLPIPYIKIDPEINNQNLEAIVYSLHPDVEILKLESEEENISFTMGQVIFRAIEEGRLRRLKQLHLWNREDMRPELQELDALINFALIRR